MAHDTLKSLSELFALKKALFALTRPPASAERSRSSSSKAAALDLARALVAGSRELLPHVVEQYEQDEASEPAVVQLGEEEREKLGLDVKCASEAHFLLGVGLYELSSLVEPSDQVSPSKRLKLDVEFHVEQNDPTALLNESVEELGIALDLLGDDYQRNQTTCTILVAGDLIKALSEQDAEMFLEAEAAATRPARKDHGDWIVFLLEDLLPSLFPLVQDELEKILPRGDPIQGLIDGVGRFLALLDSADALKGGRDEALKAVVACLTEAKQVFKDITTAEKGRADTWRLDLAVLSADAAIAGHEWAAVKLEDLEAHDWNHPSEKPGAILKAQTLAKGYLHASIKALRDAIALAETAQDSSVKQEQYERLQTAYNELLELPHDDTEQDRLHAELAVVVKEGGLGENSE